MSIEGVEQLRRQFAELASLDRGRALKRAVRAGMVPALKVAVATIPQLKEEKRGFHTTYKGGTVTKGFAKRSIRMITKADPKKGKTYALLGVRKKAYYAVNYVERGTRYQAKQPWLVPAQQTAKSDTQTKLQDSLLKDIQKAAKTK